MIQAKLEILEEEVLKRDERISVDKELLAKRDKEITELEDELENLKAHSLTEEEVEVRVRDSTSRIDSCFSTTINSHTLTIILIWVIGQFGTLSFLLFLLVHVVRLPLDIFKYNDLTSVFYVLFTVNYYSQTF